jgi:hypothetical protein
MPVCRIRRCFFCGIPSDSKCTNCKHSRNISRVSISKKNIESRRARYSKLVCCGRTNCKWCSKMSRVWFGKFVHQYSGTLGTSNIGAVLLDEKLGSMTTAAVQCAKCNHFYSLSMKEELRGRSCPICTVSEYYPTLELCDDPSCAYCYKNSLASIQDKTPELTARFRISIDSKTRPRMIRKDSEDLYYFDCSACKHQYHITVASYAEHIRNGNGCLICSATDTCDDMACVSCHGYCDVQTDQLAFAARDEYSESMMIAQNSDQISLGQPCINSCGPSRLGESKEAPIILTQIETSFRVLYAPQFTRTKPVPVIYPIRRICDVD